jgi:hypothetical protein
MLSWRVSSKELPSPRLRPGLTELTHFCCSNSVGSSPTILAMDECKLRPTLSEIIVQGRPVWRGDATPVTPAAEKAQAELLQEYEAMQVPFLKFMDERKAEDAPAPEPGMVLPALGALLRLLRHRFPQELAEAAAEARAMIAKKNREYEGRDGGVDNAWRRTQLRRHDETLEEVLRLESSCARLAEDLEALLKVDKGGYLTPLRPWLWPHALSLAACLPACSLSGI